MVFGLLAALDLGGFASWGVRLTAKVARRNATRLPLTRYLPPWLWALRDEASLERWIRRNIVGQRVAGALLAVIGLMFLGTGIVQAL